MKTGLWQVFICVLCAGCFTTLLPSCSQVAENSDPREAIEFTVDSNVLSDNMFTAGHGAFSIRPPRYWEQADSLVMASLHMEGLPGRCLLTMFKNDSSHCALVISDLAGTNPSLFQSIQENPSAYLNKDSVWSHIQPSSFFLKSYHISQYVLQNDQSLLFKLFVRGKGMKLELDYIIPRENIQNNIKSVESSIGSIQ